MRRAQMGCSLQSDAKAGDACEKYLADRVTHRIEEWNTHGKYSLRYYSGYDGEVCETSAPMILWVGGHG